MRTAEELACLLSEALEARQPDPAPVCSLLAQLIEPAALVDLDDLLLDMQAALMRAAALSPATDAAVRLVLTVAAAQCTAREVFTLCMAVLSQELSCAHDEEWEEEKEDAQNVVAAARRAYGPSSPAFQLFLLRTMGQCLPRIRRRPLHFCAELLNMQLRWAADVLPGLSSGGAAAPRAGGAAMAAATSASTSAVAMGGGGAALTVAEALASLANQGAALACWLQQAGDQLTAQEQEAGGQLVLTTVLQLVSSALQLPQHLEAAAAALPAQSRSNSISAPPSAGSRAPMMQAAAAALLQPIQVLLLQLPRDAHLETLWQQAESLPTQLATCGLDAAELPYISASGAAEGVAAAACLAACLPGCHSSQLPSGLLAAQPLLGLLSPAACVLLDCGARQRSVALTLLPLCAVCKVSAYLAASSDLQLPRSSAQLDTLLRTLVDLMSHNPVQLLRSCAHDAVHAVLDAFHPSARLEQLRAMMQMPTTAAQVVALQRLRQEMAAAWGTLTAEGGSADTAHAASSGSHDPSLWLGAAALQLALPCLAHGRAGSGWHDERHVLAQADVQAAALSLLRWLLLREKAAPRGQLPLERAQQLLQRDLLPLRACVLRVLQLQAASMAGGELSNGGEASSCGGGGHDVVLQQQALDSFLAVQRLHEALERVVEVIRAGC